MNRLGLYAAAGAIIVTLWGASIGWAYLKGEGDEAARRDRAQLEDTLAGVRVNIESWDAANAETERLRDDNQRLYGDLSHARRRLSSFNAPPAPGRVGRQALVDPDLGRLFLCDVERLRLDPPSPACRGSATDGADRDAADQ